MRPEFLFDFSAVAFIHFKGEWRVVNPFFIRISNWGERILEIGCSIDSITIRDLPFLPAGVGSSSQGGGCGGCSLDFHPNCEGGGRVSAKLCQNVRWGGGGGGGRNSSRMAKYACFLFFFFFFACSDILMNN